VQQAIARKPAFAYDPMHDREWLKDRRSALDVMLADHYSGKRPLPKVRVTAVREALDIFVGQLRRLGAA
jgi:hypothetical protein